MTTTENNHCIIICPIMQFIKLHINNLLYMTKQNVAVLSGDTVRIAQEYFSVLGIQIAVVDLLGTEA